MWVALILTCSIGTEFPDTNSCVLYQSPTIIEGTIESCVNSVSAFLSDEMFNLSLQASGMEVYNIKCVDVIGVDDIKV